MFKWIKDAVQAIAIVTAIRPMIEMFVREAETPGFGPEKKEAVKKGIKNTMEELKVPEAIQGLVQAIASGLIEVYVIYLNITKFFRHKNDEE